MIENKKKIYIKQIKSSINISKNQKNILIALGLNKINKVVIHNNNNSIIGMVKKLSHLLEIKYII